jgi:hypothetical protein
MLGKGVYGKREEFNISCKKCNSVFSNALEIRVSK